MTTPPPTRDATTVLLLRQGRSSLEVFMVKRHGRSSFMANAYVYPGGAVDAADSSDEVAAVTTGRTASQCAALLFGGTDAAADRRSLGFFVAGIRESFEEAGVLLAQDAAGAPYVPGERLQSETWRRAVHDGEWSLLELARREGLCFPLDQLWPFAHWITPTFEPKRFDTWFLVAACPPDQDLLHDAQETVDSEWVVPQAALDRHAAGELHLFPPTFRTLEELRDLGSLDAVLRHVHSAPVVPTILPHFEQLDGGLVALLPGDPGYPDAQAVPVSGPSRIELRDGRWRSCWPS